MAGSPTHPRPVHLVELGLRWPPETFLRDKLRLLAEHGLRVTAFVYGRGRGARIPGVRIRRMPRRRRSRAATLAVTLGWLVLVLVSRPRRLIRLLGELRRVEGARLGPHPRTLGLLCAFLPLARLRCDVVQFEWEQAAARHLALFDVWETPVVVACRGSGTNVHPHSPDYAETLQRLPQVFARCAAAHCVSVATRDRAAALGLDPAKAHVIYPGVDLRSFSPPDDRPHDVALRVLSVGDLYWVKAYEDALEAIAQLVRAGIPVEYDIVGGEPWQGERGSGGSGQLRFTIADLGLAEHVRLHGEIGPEAVRDRLRSANVLLHTSLSEGAPYAVAEAMACGLPVVVTSWPGVEEIVRDGVEGLVCPRRDPEAVAGALETLARDPDRREELGRAARRRAEAMFDAAAETRRFAELYEMARTREATAR